MTTIDGNRQFGGKDPWLLYLPAAWVAVIMALCAYGIWSSWPVIFDGQLPASIAYFIYVGIAASIVTILWGSYVLALALGRSARFPRAFIFWQIADIAWSLMTQAYVLIIPDFGFSLETVARVGVEIAIGLFCIQLARTGAKATADTTAPVAAHAAPAERPLLVSVLFALLGVVLGGVLGFGAGLLVAELIIEFADISCFEGACGYFAVFFALAVMLVGAVAGGIFAFRRSRRKRPPAA